MKFLIATPEDPLDSTGIHALVDSINGSPWNWHLLPGVWKQSEFGASRILWLCAHGSSATQQECCWNADESARWMYRLRRIDHEPEENPWTTSKTTKDTTRASGRAARGGKR